MATLELRVYSISDSIVFQKNDEPFGELSNMATQFPVVVNNLPFRTNEALYQVCRFPDYPDYQKSILEQKSPMGAKYESRKHNPFTRKDWEKVKVYVMRWCLRVKLAYHHDAFGQVLLSTAKKPIVEYSKIDAFWGAKPKDGVSLTGRNVLGRLLMELREELKNEKNESLFVVDPPRIQNFLIMGNPVERIVVDPVRNSLDQTDSKGVISQDESDSNQLSLPF